MFLHAWINIRVPNCHQLNAAVCKLVPAYTPNCDPVNCPLKSTSPRVESRGGGTKGYNKLGQQSIQSSGGLSWPIAVSRYTRCWMLIHEHVQYLVILGCYGGVLRRKILHAKGIPSTSDEVRPEAFTGSAFPLETGSDVPSESKLQDCVCFYSIMSQNLIEFK